MLIGLLLGLISAVACFLLLLARGLAVPVVLACCGGIAVAFFLLGLAASKLASCPKGKKPAPVPAFHPPETVTLKSKSPQELEEQLRQEEERLRKLLEERRPKTAAPAPARRSNLNKDI